MIKLRNKKFWLSLILSALVLIVLSLVLTWLLEFRYYSDSAVDVYNFITSRPHLFLFNSWLMLLILLFVSSLAGSIFRGGGITAAGVLIIGYIHINKFASRGQPLLPEDFQLASEAASLSKFVSVESLFYLVIGVLSVIVMAEVLERWVGHYLISVRMTKQELSDASWLRRHLLLPRLLVAVISVLLFMGVTAFIMQHGEGRTQRVDFLDTTFIAWNQTYNYNDNGFLVGFLYNWSKFKQTPPADYNEETITSLKEYFTEIANVQNEHKDNLTDADFNLVIILDESFTDPAVFASHYPTNGGDITPNLHRLMQENPSGYMYTIDYGGGTANVEFETITGLTNYWANTVPYTSIIPHLATLPSVANFAKANNYSTAAVHAYNSGMYKRNISLKTAGFDQFIADDDYTHTEHEGNSQFINDRSTYQEVLDLLQNDEKQLILTITMQNHTPYDQGTYETNRFALKTAPSGDQERKTHIETYFETLHRSDAYLGEFIAELAKSDRQTVVLFFGDHAPGLFSELNNSKDPDTFSVSRRMPYFIYANFDLSTNDLSYKLPTTTPNCLMNTTYNILNVAKEPLGYLLDEVCAETPILTPLYFAGDNPNETDTLNAYELVNYDILSGEQYWLK